MNKPTWDDSFEFAIKWLFMCVFTGIALWGIIFAITIFVVEPNFRLIVFGIIGTITIPVLLHQGYHRYIKSLY